MSKTEKVKKETNIDAPKEIKLGTIYAQAESLVSDTRDMLIGILKEFPTYDSMKEDAQKILHRDVEYKVEKIIHEAIKIVAEKGSTYVPAKVDSVSVKDGIKIVLKIADIDNNFSIVGDMRGKEIVVVGTSLSEFNELQKEAQIIPDQKDLIDDLEKKNPDGEVAGLSAEEDSWGKSVRSAIKKTKKKD